MAVSPDLSIAAITLTLLFILNRRKQFDIAVLLVAISKKCAQIGKRISVNQIKLVDKPILLWHFLC